MDNSDKLLEFKRSISESTREIIRVLKQAHAEVLPADKLDEVIAEVLIETLYESLGPMELETRSIFADIIAENNNMIILNDSDLELYKMIALGTA